MAKKKEEKFSSNHSPRYYAMLSLIFVICCYFDHDHRLVWALISALCYWTARMIPIHCRKRSISVKTSSDVQLQLKRTVDPVKPLELEAPNASQPDRDILSQTVGL